MHPLVSLRRIYPAVVDNVVFSCRTRTSMRLMSATMLLKSPTRNKDIKLSDVFVNRNPRNLEELGLAWKPQGWAFQYPRKDYYNKLVFERTNRHTSGRIVHWTGKTIVTASTQEWAIRQHLYSCTDVSTAANIGRVLAHRCLECGITHVFYDEEPLHAKSEKMQAFLKAIREGQVQLEEPVVDSLKALPGINYDKPNRYAEPKKWKEDYQID
ncbi:hypothetical protein ScPMuIL_006814 [Solemya velum]